MKRGAFARPLEGEVFWPAVICPHGHCSGGKAAVAGLRDHPDVAHRIDKYKTVQNPAARTGIRDAIWRL